jgi:hypothetical protein
MSKPRHLFASLVYAIAVLAAHGAALAQPTPAPAAPTMHDGAHDFDFEFGVWKMQMKRLRHPLTHSTTWFEMSGTTVNRRVFGGRANLAEVEGDGPNGHLQLASFRLYNVESHQWTISFAGGSGLLAPPMTGEFHDGRGEFYDQETYNGRMILVRFTIYSVTPTTAHSEQAFSDDGGKTWETNWINDYERIGDA